MLEAELDHSSQAPPGTPAGASVDTLDRIIRVIIRVLAIGFAAFSIAEINLALLAPFQQRAVFLAFPLALCFLVAARTARNDGALYRRSRNLFLYALAILSFVVCGYILLDYTALINRMGSATTLDLVVSAAGLLLVLEATRRLAGWTLPVISLAFILYAHEGYRLPVYLGGHAGYDLNRILTQLFLTMEGIFGIALSVMFTYVFPFVLFGVVLEAVGGLGFAIDLAQALFGRFRGGPAKVSVVSSAMLGMINGSAVANVVTGGSLTIPMMKRAGFKPHVAGAIEAVASTGGQLTPPVMGAAAFMMAEFLNVPYLSIARAALIPALLFYLALFTTIHFYSARHDLGGVATAGPDAGVAAILRRHDLYLFAIPVACLIGMMIYGYSTTKSVSYALVAAFLASLPVRERRLTPTRMLRALEKAAHDALPLCCASACVGIVIGMVLVTALGSRFTSIIMEMAAGNIYAALVLVMFASVLLGLGLPTTVCYVLLATLAAPALVQLGVAPLAAHMFIFYFGMMSMVTPPEAMAAYAGAAIARANIMQTGMTAWMFSLCGYLLPFMFVLNPALLLVGSAAAIVQAVITGSVGAMALGAAVAGFIRTRLAFWERAFLFIAAAALIHPGPASDLAGAAFLAAVLFRQYGRKPAPPRSSAG